MQEMWVQSLGWEDPLEEQMAPCSSILAWEIPGTEEPGGLQTMGSHGVRRDWVTEHTHIRWITTMCCSLFWSPEKSTVNGASRPALVELLCWSPDSVSCVWCLWLGISVIMVLLFSAFVAVVVHSQFYDKIQSNERGRTGFVDADGKLDHMTRWWCWFFIIITVAFKMQQLALVFKIAKGFSLGLRLVFWNCAFWW